MLMELNDNQISAASGAGLTDWVAGWVVGQLLDAGAAYVRNGSMDSDQMDYYFNHLDAMGNYYG